MLDMTKAYDKVRHDILLNKLYGSGIRGNVYNWLKSYLENRRQFVQIEYCQENTRTIEKINSDTRHVKGSIPQGSVLGCVIFLVYVNDLPKTLDTSCIMFADDVSLTINCTNDNECNTNTRIALDKVENWLSEHNLQINYNKTKIIQFRPHQKQPLNINLTSNNIQIEEVQHFTLLGITIDSSLNWKAHICNIKSKLARFHFALSVLKVNTNFETALSAYYAYAYAWLRYGVVLWGASTDAKELFIMQKKCLRILTNLRSTETCRPHFVDKQLLTLPSIYILEVCVFVREHMHFFKQIKDAPNRRIKTRHENRLDLPKSNLAMHSNSPFVRFIKIYNKAPGNIKAENKHHIFKRKLKNLLIKKAYYTIDEFMNDTDL
jgi:hypothetical protein